jgi:predicted GNAT family acetyltransferase
MRIVAARMLARGETPWLHAYATNTGAIALYESLGFRHRAVNRASILVRV